VNFEYAEGATPLSDEEAEGLLLSHISTRAELDRWEQEGIMAAEAKIFARKPKGILTESFILRLHDLMFGGIWKWAGTQRKSDKNIGGAWWGVAAALRDLSADVQMWVDNGTFPPDEIAVRLHHRLVAIHYFPNGNGRHARLMADLVLVHLLGQPVFTWGGENLVNRGDCRKRYIEALRAADRKDYAPLLAFVRS